MRGRGREEREGGREEIEKGEGREEGEGRKGGE